MYNNDQNVGLNLSPVVTALNGTRDGRDRILLLVWTRNVEKLKMACSCRTRMKEANKASKGFIV